MRGRGGEKKGGRETVSKKEPSISGMNTSGEVPLARERAIRFRFGGGKHMDGRVRVQADTA